MGGKPLRCRMGLHRWVKCHPLEEGPQRWTDRWVCTQCRKNRTAGDIPLAGLG